MRRMVVNEVIGWRRRRSSTERPYAEPPDRAGDIVAGGPDRRDRRRLGRARAARPAAAGRGGAPLLRAPVRGRDRRRPRHPPGHGEVAVLGRPRQPAPDPRTGRRDEGGARMNIEQTLTETIERHVATVESPRVDLGAVRRVGRRRARVRTGLVAAAVAVIVGGGCVRRRRPGRERHRAKDIKPVDLPQMDFANGLQAWFNPDDNQVHMGGEDVRHRERPRPRHVRLDHAVRAGVLRRGPGRAPAPRRRVGDGARRGARRSPATSIRP